PVVAGMGAARGPGAGAGADRRLLPPLVAVMTLKDRSLLVVTPVFEDREASARLFAELGHLFGRDVYVIAVDDGSVRQPLDPASLQSAGVAGVVIRLRRNVGHQRAIAIGLGYAAEHMT